MFTRSNLTKSILAFVAVASLSLFPCSAEANRPGGGVRIHNDTVVANGTDVYEPEFIPGQARIVVDGDHTTDLDCFVVSADDAETPITSSTNSTDTCVLDFVVLTRGVVRVKVYNLGDVYNDYAIAFR